MSFTITRSCTEPGPRGTLRTQSSTRLDSTESTFAATAGEKWRTAFTRAHEENVEDDSSFTFADRSHWPKFQSLLLRVESAERADAGNSELQTATDAALHSFEGVVSSVLSTMKERLTSPVEEAFLEETYVASELKECVFVGHLATDLDSIAGAIGAADLFGGIPAKSESELNGEILYALKEVADLQEPELFDNIPGAGIPASTEAGQEVWKPVCLVDHSEEKQMVKSLRNHPNRRKRIIGLIDHHALAASFSSDTPIFVDLRPWGCMATIVAHMYLRRNKNPGPKIARILMCAILSDTLNLQSVTTTDADRFALALLAKIGHVDDPDEVARLMFRAKTKWIVNLGPYAMVRGDQKDFEVNGWKFGIAVLEVTVVDQVLEVADKLILELRALKVDKGAGDRKKELDFAFLFVVNVVKQCSFLLVCGGREYVLAEKAFPGCPFYAAKAGMPAPGTHITAEQTLCDVGPLVSRKAQFVPAFSQVLNAGFKCHKHPVSSDLYMDSDDDTSIRNAILSGAADVHMDDAQNLSRDMSLLSSHVFGGEFGMSMASTTPQKVAPTPSTLYLPNEPAFASKDEEIAYLRRELSKLAK